MLWYFLGWIIGVLSGSFFLIQSLTILFFGYANVNRMKKIGALAIESRANTTHTISLFLLLGLFALSSWGVGRLDSRIELGYYIGVALMIVFGIKGTFNTKTNRAEFIEKNIRYINPEFLMQYVHALYETETDLKWLDKHIRTLEIKSGYSLTIETVDALILDSLKENPYKETWTIGKDISKDQAEKFFNEEDKLIYVLRFFDNGETKEMVVTKEYFYKSLHELNNIFESAKG